jgi:acyl-CoA dehydrogenase
VDFDFDRQTKDLCANVTAFVRECVRPAEAEFSRQVDSLDEPWAWSRAPVLRDLQAEAGRRGLWNLFLPGSDGAGLTNLQYAPLAEISGHCMPLAPAAMNCAAPDTGNMEVLAMFGTPEQRSQWLEPLLRAEIRSAFAMTEPDVASSDATNIATRIARDGNDLVVNGRKRWITGAMNPDAKLLIVMGVTRPDADRHHRHSQVIVPRDTPGVFVRRGMTVLGYDDRDHGGHAEIEFRDVRVPISNLIGEDGGGFTIAQARLGPGRIHHCMRAIGMGEQAIQLMCARAEERTAFGKRLADQGVVREWIAEARVRIEQLRLLVLKAAWLMDTVGNKQAHTEIQAIKIATPDTIGWILDRAIQVHGAAGLGQDLPLASSAAFIRALRFGDGPDEVHKNALARNELRRQALTADTPNLMTSKA